MTCIGWIGHHRLALQWLQDRIRSAGFEIVDFGKVEPRGVQRIIVEAPDRTSIDSQQWSAFPEVPVAIATDNWWDGSGRTGLKEFGKPLIPWFRWWESWIPWLQEHPRSICRPYPRGTFTLLPAVVGKSSIRDLLRRL